MFVQKSINLLAVGVVAMIMSCLVLLSLIVLTNKKVTCGENQGVDDCMKLWKLDEAFLLFGVMVIVLSMGSSSMIEEEHYIWHFLTSSVNFLFLRKMMQSFKPNRAHDHLNVIEGQNNRLGCQISSVFLILLAGRILRGWHQGGVNWTYLPDISKWLLQNGSHYIKLIHITSCVLIICLGLFLLYVMKFRTKVVMMVGISFSLSGLLVLQHLIKHQDMFVSFSIDATLSIQTIYAFLGISTVAVVLALPWIMAIRSPKKCSKHDSYMSNSVISEIENVSPILEVKDSLYVIGCVYVTSWCILQLLLQQPVNAMPVLLLFVQVLASMLIFSSSGPHHKKWVEVSCKISQD